MHIESIDIRNFRRLKSVRLELSNETTLIVGANNSGKTSALTALSAFLSGSSAKLRISDITASNWERINEIASKWGPDNHSSQDDVLPLNNLLPSIDIWLSVEDHELHRVAAIIPNLSWEGGLLGLRIALSVADIKALYREYMLEREKGIQIAALRTEKENELRPVHPYAQNLVDFLSAANTNKFFEFAYYALDGAHRGAATEKDWRPQEISSEHMRLEKNPLKHLITINQIPAFRGFDDLSGASDDSPSTNSSRLANHLTSFYKTHLNPDNEPTESDYQALVSIIDAKSTFEAHFQAAFRDPLRELESVGYPGGGNPEIQLHADIKTEALLDHKSAVSFTVKSGEDEAPGFALPETQNGLGYRNLVYMMLKLISFREGWLQPGKERPDNEASTITPIHLVIIEEPEAHLHVQVQQVFARTAFGTLNRNTIDSPDQSHLTTQLVMSTHSSSVAHEMDYSQLRYFHRNNKPDVSEVPTSTTINMSEIFGAGDHTQKFVTRYLKAYHSDLFFADAVILVEGAAERILLPNLIRKTDSLEHLRRSYVSILEIGGSHAHRLKPLIEALRIPTLVITDIDATSNDTKAIPEYGMGYKTSNSTLGANWADFTEDIDALLELSSESKVRNQPGTDFPQVYFAYQTLVSFRDPVTNEEGEACGSTFEDSLVLENLSFFASSEGNGLIKKFRDCINGSQEKTDKGEDENISSGRIPRGLYDAIQGADKAKFSLDVLFLDNFDDLQTPTYIREGLEWLQSQLRGTLNGPDNHAGESRLGALQ